jgi:hypothetical protein
MAGKSKERDQGHGRRYGTFRVLLNMQTQAPPYRPFHNNAMRNQDMRQRLGGLWLAACALLAACDGDATSPSYSLDLAEITVEVPSRALSVADSAFVGEPLRITAYATNRGCESPGGLSVTTSADRVRIVGAVQVASGTALQCQDIGGWPQTTTATPTVEGSLTIVLIGRVRDRTDSVSRVVRVVPRRALQGTVAAAAAAAVPVSVGRSGAE